MAYRVTARFEDQTIRATLHPGRNLIGSDPSCEICLPNPTVSRRHAAVHVHADRIELEDMGSTNGTLLRSQRIERADLEPNDIFVIGRVVVLLEDMIDDDLEVGIHMPRPTVDPSGVIDLGDLKEHTESFSPLEAFTLEHLPELLNQLCRGGDRPQMAQNIGAVLFKTMPVLAVEILDQDEEHEEGLLYSAKLGHEPPGDGPDWQEGVVGSCRVRVRFFNRRAAEHFQPVIDASALLFTLAGDRVIASQIAPVQCSAPERPKPPSVEPTVQEIYDQAERIARGDVGVMIFGESGTGKEVLAGFLHAASPRNGQGFVAINCASLPRDLLESELFGVEKGVATGVEARPGKFELADKGTLFLDEIGDMAAETQAKILRVLQEKNVYRIGGSTPHSADIRIIAATNRPVKEMIAEGTFRADLYHRIATWEVELPALRHRRSDIPNLAVHFLQEEAQRYGIRPRGVSRAALQMLQRYRWPGNIRQLRNEIARAVLFLEDKELLDTKRLSPTIREEQEDRLGQSLTEILEAVEREEITAALEAVGGETTAAADLLKISRSTLYRRIKVLGIEAGS